MLDHIDIHIKVPRVDYEKRAYHRTRSVKLSRTIADLAGSEEIQSPHLAEAVHASQPPKDHDGVISPGLPSGRDYTLPLFDSMTLLTFQKTECHPVVRVFPTILKKDADFPRYKDFLKRWTITLALSDFSDSIFKEASQWLWNRKMFSCECRKISNALCKKRLENAAG